MDKMIRDLLDVNSINAGEPLILKYKYCDIFALIKKVLNPLTIVYGPRFKLHGQTIHGYWSAEHLQRAIENLCVNAVKYSSSQILKTLRLRQERLSNQHYKLKKKLLL